MRGAEGVVHVEVGESGQRLREYGIVLFFFSVEAQVLEQHEATCRRACAAATAMRAGSPMQSLANVTGT